MTDPKQPTLLITNIGNCLTFDPKKGGGAMGIVSDAVVAIAGREILWVGHRKKHRSQHSEGTEVDAGGKLLTPGLIDCHTHALFAGQRADEFFARLSGESYEEIAKRGGGIQRTTEATDEAADGQVLDETRRRLDRFLKFGVTTIEVKSGYGLSALGEMRMLCLIQEIRHTIDVIPTFLGAHAVPREYRKRRDAYVKLVCEEMLPQVSMQKLSGICDVFCDKGAFTVEETRTIFKAAKKLGLQVKLHADQLSAGGGAELAAEFEALSADHLENVSTKGIRALAKSGTVAVLLPGAVFSLGKNNYPPARKLLDAGVKVALSTDCNPGTSYSENLPLMMSFAASEMKMTIDEIWRGVTVNAAQALGLTDRGAIRPGMLADLAIWDAETPEEIPYHYGASLPKSVIKCGKTVLDIG
ncbi:MAG: imidazolonepropionase [Pseudomonadota bacterium]